MPPDPSSPAQRPEEPHWPRGSGPASGLPVPANTGTQGPSPRNDSERRLQCREVTARESLCAGGDSGVCSRLPSCPLPLAGQPAFLGYLLSKRLGLLLPVITRTSQISQIDPI